MEFKISRYGEDSKPVLTSDAQLDLFQARIEERRRKRNLLKNNLNVDEKENVAKAKKNEKSDDIAATTDVKKKKRKKKQMNIEVEERKDLLNTDIPVGNASGGEKHIAATSNPLGKKKKKLKLFISDNIKEVSEIDLVENCDKLESTHATNNIDSKLKGDKKIKRKKKKRKAFKEDIKINDNSDTDNGSELKDVSKIAEKNLNGSFISNDVSEENSNILDKENPVECNENFFPILGKQKREKKQLVKRTLPRWLNEPIFMSLDIDSCKVSLNSVNFLSNTTVGNLNSNGIHWLFPVQASVVEKIISQHHKNANKFPPRDICVQAPTGSGKTLAYTLAVVEILSHFIVKQLHCLIVLPSKDLAMQVKKVVDSYVVGTNLKVALASGVKTFPKEQEKLIAKGVDSYFSKADILVCTPGRLVDHLKETPGFTLRYLRFLVVDEADRLLGQNYSSWLEEVKTSVYSADSHTMRRQKLIPLNASTFLNSQLPFQKLLFSATLTQNPEKIAPLELYNPMLFTTRKDFDNEEEQILENDMEETDGERYIIPEKLVEQMVVVEDDEKPLILLYLMITMSWKGVLCFTKSIESTHRLALLMQKFKGFSVAEFSSDLSETQRKGIIRDYNNGNIDLLISSDAMARGMDIEKVKLVVNYDTARNAKTYVHRVGRTARAGKEGFAITILCRKEVFHFKLMMKKLSGKVIPKLSVEKKGLHSFQGQYEEALSSLQKTINIEKRAINKGTYMKKT